MSVGRSSLGTVPVPLPAGNDPQGPHESSSENNALSAGCLPDIEVGTGSPSALSPHSADVDSSAPTTMIDSAYEKQKADIIEASTAVVISANRKFDPLDPKRLWTTVDILIRLGRFSKAAPLIRRLILLEAESAKHRKLADLCMKAGLFPEAVELLEAVRTKARGSAAEKTREKTALPLAQARLLAGDLAGARAELPQDDEGNPSWIALRAMIEYSSGNPEASLSALDKLSGRVLIRAVVEIWCGWPAPALVRVVEHYVDDYAGQPKFAPPYSEFGGSIDELLFSPFVIHAQCQATLAANEHWNFLRGYCGLVPELDRIVVDAEVPDLSESELGAIRSGGRGLTIDPPENDVPSIQVEAEKTHRRVADGAELQQRFVTSRLGRSVDGAWVPDFIEGEPSRKHSEEISELDHDAWASDDKRSGRTFMFVPQSEGRASKDLSLAATGITVCSLYLLRNIDTGNALAIHHDSDSRITWTKDWHSPRSSKLELMDRSSVGYKKFMQEEGRKFVLQVDTELAYDRRDMLDWFASEGIGVLKPLVMKAIPDIEHRPEWNVAYRPKSDQLLIQFRNAGGGQVMHYRQVFRETGHMEGPPIARRHVAQARAGDVVDRMQEYQALLQQPGAVSQDARAVIEACLKVVKFRNANTGHARNALSEVRKLDAIPPEIAKLLEDSATDHADLYTKGGPVIRGLTQLVEHVLAPASSSGATNANEP